MNPSSLSTRATRCLNLVDGISTNCRSMRVAFRMRVSMSARESVIMSAYPSPAGFLNARDEPITGHVAETDAADAELAVHRPRPPAQPAPQPNADLVARPHLDLVRLAPAQLQLFHLFTEFDVFRFGGHKSPTLLIKSPGRACQ